MDALVAEWLIGHDTGISSVTIVAVMESDGLIAQYRRYGHPHDPADLGRCIRLLDIAPAWYRLNLHRMKQVSPQWSALVDHWSELETLYRQELPTGRAPKCYARMRELIDASVAEK